MSHISYKNRADRIAHGARTAKELSQYRASVNLRQSVKFEAPAFNRSGWEAAAVGILGALLYTLVTVAF